ncbi:MAG: DUF177 domain-containing protein [Bacillota bacterium]|nr:DUF177 domain-containing protein [Bacillota bacterium]MDW7684458.1 DUF177 domain-containing protein [Bacillota bacterium]
MRIALETLKNTPGETFQYTFSTNAAQLELSDEDIRFTEPVELHLEVAYRDGKYIVKGSLRTKMAFTCSRCLTSFTSPLRGDIEEEFPASETTELDLAGLAREIIYAGLPLKPLCEDACLGLCTACGENLNDKQCGCNTDEVDHRLAVLKKLLEE